MMIRIFPMGRFWDDGLTHVKLSFSRSNQQIYTLLGINGIPWGYITSHPFKTIPWGYTLFQKLVISNRGVWSKGGILGVPGMGFWWWLLSNYGVEPLSASGKHTKNDGKSWKITIFNSYINIINCKLPWLQVRKLLVIARGYHNPHPRDLHSKSEVTRWGPPRYKLGWMRQPIPRHSEWKVLMMLMFGQACSQHPGWFWGGLGNTSAKSRIFGTQMAITYLEWVGTTLFGVRHFERVAHFLIQGMTRQYFEMWQFHGQHWVPIQQSELVFLAYSPSYRI